MPKPDVYSPTDTLVAVAKAMAPWAGDHEVALAKELGEGHDSSAKAERLSDGLDAAQKDFDKEQIEDKALTTERDVLLDGIRNFDRGVRASVARRLRKEGQVGERATADFKARPPSHVRSTRAAKTQLDDLETAIKIHAALLTGHGADRTQDWLTTIAAHQAALVDITLRMGKDTEETARARTRRDDAVAAVADFITDLDLAAAAVIASDPGVTAKLRLLFDTHNPQTF